MADEDSEPPGHLRRRRISPHWITAIGTVALVIIALVSYAASTGGAAKVASGSTTSSSTPLLATSTSRTSDPGSSSTTSVQSDSGGDNPTLTLVPDSGTVGTQVVATISHFAPDEKLDFAFNGLQEGNEPTTSGDGSVVVTFTIPGQFQGLSATATATADALFGPDQAQDNFTLTG
jgi:hypothetical protein